MRDLAEKGESVLIEEDGKTYEFRLVPVGYSRRQGLQLSASIDFTRRQPNLPSFKENSKTMSYEEAALILGVSAQRVNELVKLGVLECSDNGLSREDVLRHCRERADEQDCPLTHFWAEPNATELFFPDVSPIAKT